ncbi:MAG TPA: response regulator [Candidatus Aquilonibacter sp.]|nr:response regulator [Candidatus Aquilonibacter sp.]
MADALAYLDDIFFQAKITETARILGVVLQICASPQALAAELAANKPHLIIIDLNAHTNPFDAIAIASKEGQGVPLIAFLSHVQTELAERARAAGCAEVMPRSKFSRDLATILARAKSQS